MLILPPEHTHTHRHYAELSSKDKCISRKGHSFGNYVIILWIILQARVFPIIQGLLMRNLAQPILAPPEQKQSNWKFDAFLFFTYVTNSWKGQTCSACKGFISSRRRISVKTTDEGEWIHYSSGKFFILAFMWIFTLIYITHINITGHHTCPRGAATLLPATLWFIQEWLEEHDK